MKSTTVVVKIFKEEKVSKNCFYRIHYTFLDGHPSHYPCNVLDAARENGVACFVLPPNQTAALQPLDRVVFSPFKRALSNLLHTWVSEHPLEQGKNDGRHPCNPLPCLHHINDTREHEGRIPENWIVLDIEEAMPPAPQRCRSGKRTLEEWRRRWTRR